MIPPTSFTFLALRFFFFRTARTDALLGWATIVFRVGQIGHFYDCLIHPDLANSFNARFVRRGCHDKFSMLWETASPQVQIRIRRYLDCRWIISYEMIYPNISWLVRATCVKGPLIFGQPINKQLINLYCLKSNRFLG
jgi:hypothetical protein